MTSGFDNLLMTGELLKIWELLRRAGIPAMPLKGPLLSLVLYEDVGRRRFVDLDLLVRKRDLAPAERALSAAGYRPQPELRGLRLAAHRASQCHLQLKNPGTGVWVELHWDLTPSYFHVPFELEGLWKRAIRLEVGAERLPFLSWEDNLLFLCVHGSKHLWERRDWVRDIAALLEAAPPLDWTGVDRMAARLGARRLLWLGLLLATDLEGTPLPPGLADRIRRDAAVLWLADRMKGRLALGLKGPFGFRELLPFYWRMRERLPDRVRDTAAHAGVLLVPTAKEWERWPLPDALFPLYYGIKPLRLAGKYTGRFLRS